MGRVVTTNSWMEDFYPFVSVFATEHLLKVRLLLASARFCLLSSSGLHTVEYQARVTEYKLVTVVTSTAITKIILPPKLLHLKPGPTELALPVT